MPPFEFTLVTRPLAKTDLVNVLHRLTSVFLDRGAIVTKLDSLGHRDLNFRGRDKHTNEHVYASNHFMVSCHMSLDTCNKLYSTLKNDRDLVRFGIVNMNTLVESPEECQLEDLLKPAAYRQSVQDLRVRQKMGHFTRQRIYKRTEREWRSVPKSYPIARPQS